MRKERGNAHLRAKIEGEHGCGDAKQAVPFPLPAPALASPGDKRTGEGKGKLICSQACQ